MELPMCGHGTVCLITSLAEIRLLACDGDDWHAAVLDLPNGVAKVEYRRTAADRTEIMLDVAPARFAPANLNLEDLAQILGIGRADISAQLPPEVATGDFIHLCLPMRDLEAMQGLQPDFAALANLCVANGLETVAAFSTEVVDSAHDLHVRDFCPAVGVVESAAAGPTNAALAAYLLRHDRVQTDGVGMVTVRAKQGL